MSANDWSRCPLCQADARADGATDDDLYRIDTDVREDWEFGLDGNRPCDNEIIIEYKAVCAKCGGRAEVSTRVWLVRP